MHTDRGAKISFLHQFQRQQGNAQTRSPLDAAPLRVAGESLDAELNDLIFDQLLSPYLVAAFLVLLAGLEWWRYYTDLKPSPWLFTAAAALAIVYAAFRMRQGYRAGRRLKLGRSGERAVGQYLERFRKKGFCVFHDVPCGNANIDHLLIGTRGIFAVETKTISKPRRGDARVSVRNDMVYVNGQALDRNPLVQAKAQARWLHNFFAEQEFKTFVKPVVVFPGWFVERCDMKALGVWVLEPKALWQFIENEKEVLSAEEAKAMASAISSYIRSQTRL